MMMKGSLILDFDSTFISVETLDILVDIACATQPNYAEIKHYISELTRLTMAGQYSFHEALTERFNYMLLHHQDILKCSTFLKTKITTSFLTNRKFLENHAEQIYIFSGGFSEIIIPVVAQFQIPKNHVFANHFVYKDEQVLGVDKSNIMTHGDGKSKLLEQLNPPGPIYVIGDGATDAIMKNTGLVETFYLFTENIYRETVAPYADKIINSIEPFILEHCKHQISE